MKKAFLLSAALLTTLTFYSSVVLAQAQTGACFYEDTHYQGRSFCLYQGEQVENLGQFGGGSWDHWNDRTSSVWVSQPTISAY